MFVNLIVVKMKLVNDNNICCANCIINAFASVSCIHKWCQDLHDNSDSTVTSAFVKLMASAREHKKKRCADVLNCELIIQLVRGESQEFADG